MQKSMDELWDDMEASGMVIYSYTAKNEAGYTINIFSAAGANGLEIQKP